MSSRRVKLKKKWTAAINAAERCQLHLIEMRPIYRKFHPEISRQLQRLCEGQQCLVMVMQQLADSL